jgi:hypothetical protein
MKLFAMSLLWNYAAEIIGRVTADNAIECLDRSSAISGP